MQIIQEKGQKKVVFFFKVRKTLKRNRNEWACLIFPQTLLCGCWDEFTETFRLLPETWSLPSGSHFHPTRHATPFDLDSFEDAAEWAMPSLSITTFTLQELIHVQSRQSNHILIALSWITRTHQLTHCFHWAFLKGESARLGGKLGDAFEYDVLYSLSNGT